MATINDNLYQFDNIISEFTKLSAENNIQIIKQFNKNWNPNINHNSNRIIYFINETNKVEKIYEINFLYNNLCYIKRLLYNSTKFNPDVVDIKQITKYIIKSLEINIKNIEIINLIAFKILFYTNRIPENKNWILYKENQTLDIENNRLEGTLNAYIKTLILNTSFNDSKLNFSYTKIQLNENNINKQLTDVKKTQPTNTSDQTLPTTQPPTFSTFVQPTTQSSPFSTFGQTPTNTQPSPFSTFGQTPTTQPATTQPSPFSTFGQTPTTQPATTQPATTQPSPFSTFGQTSTTQPSPFGQNPITQSSTFSTFGQTPTTQPSPFSNFSQTQPTTAKPSTFVQTQPTSTFGNTTFLYGFNQGTNAFTKSAPK
jgi:hypothetical protein